MRKFIFFAAVFGSLAVFGSFRVVPVARADTVQNAYDCLMDKCSSAMNACANDSKCYDVLMCGVNCGTDASCLEGCTPGAPGTLSKLTSIYQCGKQNSCYPSAAGNPAAAGPTAGNPTNTGAPGVESKIDLKELNPLGCTDLKCVLGDLLDLFTGLATVVVSFMVLWGGFQILTAGGDPEKVKTGGKTVLYSAIGLVVVWLARGAVSIIESIVSK